MPYTTHVKVLMVTCSAFIFAFMWTPPSNKKHKHTFPVGGSLVWATAVSQHACFGGFYSHFWVLLCVVTTSLSNFPNETWYCYCRLRNVFQLVRLYSHFFACSWKASVWGSTVCSFPLYECELTYTTCRAKVSTQLFLEVCGRALLATQCSCYCYNRC